MTINDLLIQHEGLRLKPYTDTRGILTIGVGRNLDSVGISKNEALYLLQNDIDRVSLALDGAIPWWRLMDPVRQLVFLDMAFNLGVASFLGFKVTLELCRQGHYDAASVEGLRSAWAEQVGARAVQLMGMLRTGLAVSL